MKKNFWFSARSAKRKRRAARAKNTPAKSRPSNSSRCRRAASAKTERYKHLKSKTARKKRKTTRKKTRPTRKAIRRLQTSLKPKEILLGEVTHYFPKVRAAVVLLKRRAHVGMPIHVKGKKTDFRQTIGSMQINRTPVESASGGDEVGLEVLREVASGDHVTLSG